MADPLSIAGLVTGVVSLGLQTAAGLLKYLDAVKGCEEELKSAKQRATNMKDLLLAVQDLLPEVKTSWPTSATSIEHHVQSCNTEISALYALLSEFSQPASSGSKFQLKLAKQKQKLTYPFKRSHISHLEERLATVNSALQTTLQLTGLDVSITTGTKLREVHESFTATGNQIRKLHDVSISTRDQLQQVRDNSITTGTQVQKAHDVAVTALNEVRQMHDELRAMYQLTIPRVQSTAACLSFTASGTSQTIPQRETEVSVDSIEVARSLASKPSLLSSSMETVTKCRTLLLSSSRNKLLSCLCRPSRNFSHSRRVWGPFSFSYGTSGTMRHLPSCPLSQINSEERATHFTIEYSGLNRLLHTAFALSFANSYGAGGRSIGPSFAYYPAVDSTTAPAFRMMDLIQDISIYHNQKIDTGAKILEYCFDNILRLYRMGKAGPRDIDSMGNTILHAAVRIIRDSIYDIKHTISPADASLLVSITFLGLTKLVNCGVPLAVYDNFGGTACNYMLDQRDFHEVSDDLVKLLIPKAPDAPLVQGRWGNESIGIFLEDLMIAEAAGCGPLSLAAISGDEKLVQEIISRHPESLGEINQYGHTPLHLAIHHPSCLRLILKMSGQSLLDNDDFVGRRALEYACAGGYRESARVLLAFDSRIEPALLEIVDPSCEDDFLVSLKQRRDELKWLALDNLTMAEAESLKLDENTVLDANAYKVQQLLQKRGINVPIHLYVEPSSDSWVYFLNFSPGNVRRIFDRLWALGFRDIDNINDYGVSPIMENWDFNATRWLIEHGADYWTPIDARSDKTSITARVTPVHFIFYRAGDRFKLGTWTPEKLLLVRVSDACSCSCSVGGCTPLKAFLDGLYSVRWQPLEEWVRNLVEFIQFFGISLRPEDLTLFVRRMTFDALMLTHSCCRFAGQAREYSERPRLTSEEIDEINSEQSFLLGLFADLVVEFEQVAFEDRGGMPLIASYPEEFWIHRWLPRIGETLDTLDGDDLTQEEKSAAEAIGVVWGPHPAPKIECEHNGLAMDSPEWVMREMEKIMNK